MNFSASSSDVIVLHFARSSCERKYASGEEPQFLYFDRPPARADAAAAAASRVTARILETRIETSMSRKAPRDDLPTRELTAPRSRWRSAPRSLQASSGS